MAVLKGLAPESVFAYFEEICSIPHGSGHTKQISDYLCNFAKERKLEYIQDQLGNVLIKKPGAEGYEEAPVVILQGHMDMVLDQTEDSAIDMENEGLLLKVKDDIITAEGTTLGGDDGIAVAYMLALLDAKDIPHPPVEAVFTVDEEIGMLGAAAFDMSKLDGKILLNIDSEDEGVLLCSCAGGVTVSATLPVERERDEGYFAKISLEGLCGGHSGVEIHKGRASANHLLGRVLSELEETVSYRLITLHGGSKDNVIPNFAEAELLLDEAGDVKELIQQAALINETLRHEYEATDPDMKLVVSIADRTKKANAMTYQSSSAVTAALYGFPSGVIRMSHEIPGLVQTSLNLGILDSDVKEVSFSFSVRSSVASEKNALVGRIRSLIWQLGGDLSVSGDYPAWEYKKESKLRDLMSRVFEAQYGYAPKVEAIHAGVECGFFAGGIEGLDAISFGPDMRDIHTANESMDVKSVARTWDFLLATLKEIGHDW